MLKKIKNAPTVDITWQGEVVASVRGLTPADVTSILVAVGEDLAGLLDLAEEVDGMKLEVKDAGVLADQLMQQWPKIVSAIGTHLPNMLSQIIANAADAPDEWEMVRDHYSFVLQFEILAEIAKLTFNEPEAFRRFVGNALLLVDLAGTLTSGSKKRPKTPAVPQSSAAG